MAIKRFALSDPIKKERRDSETKAKPKFIKKCYYIFSLSFSLSQSDGVITIHLAL